ncbi:hypothetical protein, partial [Holdemanella biformis]|uniref:hypothetical protein n=1 Tax=Holdemanella biformis TaxID=1735 RepID=UPI001E3371F0
STISSYRTFRGIQLANKVRRRRATVVWIKKYDIQIKKIKTIKTIESAAIRTKKGWQYCHLGLRIQL